MIAAVVLAAGRSQRMGRPKMLLPWGKTTVIGQVVETLARAGVTEIVVVAGGERAEMEKALQGTPARVVYNPEYRDDEMLHSFQAGLSTLLNREVSAVLVALGDQPQIEEKVVRSVLKERPADPHRIVVPSYRLHRGHPWLLPRAWWEAVMALEPPTTLRDFLNKHEGMIDYLEVDTPTVLQDLDTPDDYRRSAPAAQ